MGLKECQIQLDNPWNTYYAGQTINGQVLYTFDSPKKVRGINICFKGEANTSWTESESRTDREGKSYDENVVYNGHEEYFSIQYYLLGGRTGGELELPAGTHSYPFTCALPPSLPSSFEGEYGHVRYTIKVTLDRPWKFDQDTKMAFTIVSPVDLNLDPRVKEPVKLELEKTFCCCWCESGPLSLVVHIPVTGFVSGQEIPITTECDNASNVRVDKVFISFRKRISFYTQNPSRQTKTDYVTIAEINTDPIEPRESQTINHKIVIPPLPPSNLVNCSLIDLGYEIKVATVCPGIRRGLSTEIPIILGTIPLINYQQGPPAAPYRDLPVDPAQVNPNIQPIQPNGNGDPNNPPPMTGGWAMPTGDNPGPPLGAPHAMYPTIPQPTYNEGNFVPSTIADKYDTEHTRITTETFAPRYPTYAFNPSAPPQ